MRSIVRITVFFLLVFIWSGCDEDDDDDYCNISCQNGGSVDFSDCSCDCLPGYSGSSCQNEPEPTGYKVTRIEINNMPQCWLSGNPIDVPPDDPQPDIRIKLVHPSVIYTSGIDYGASQVDFNNLNWVVNSNSGSSTIKIIDLDNLGAVSVEELLLNVNFNFSILQSESDGVLSRQINEAFSPNCYPGSSPAWVRLHFELID